VDRVVVQVGVWAAAVVGLFPVLLSCPGRLIGFVGLAILASEFASAQWVAAVVRARLGNCATRWGGCCELVPPPWLLNSLSGRWWQC
jgi:hypothetical protein